MATMHSRAHAQEAPRPGHSPRAHPSPCAPTLLIRVLLAAAVALMGASTIARCIALSPD